MDRKEDSIISVESTEKGFKYWINHSFTPDYLKDRLKEVNVLFVPAEGFLDYRGPVFPTGTRELYQFVCKNAPDDMIIEAAVDEADYKELALHSSLIIGGAFVVTAIVAPIFVNLVSEYLKNRWGSKFLSKSDSHVKFELIRQNRDSCVKLHYEGPAATFEAAFLKKLSDLASTEEEKGENLRRNNLIP